jgi:hypothetical protein
MKQYENIIQNSIKGVRLVYTNINFEEKASPS